MGKIGCLFAVWAVCVTGVRADTTVTNGCLAVTRVDDNNGDGLGSRVVSTSDNNRLVGYYLSSTLDMHLVYVFQMTGVSDPSDIVGADFSATQTSTSSGFNIDACVIRTSTNSAVLTSDYQTVDEMLMEDFSDHSSTGLKALDSGGQENLAAYLQQNWAEGEYLFVGLRTDPLTLTNFTSNAYAKFDDDGVLSVTVSDPDPNWEAVTALGDLTNAPSVYTTNGVPTNITVGAIQSIMYDGQDYTGSPTRVWAYVGIPAGASAAEPVPAVVCVHGGGGTAYSDWIEHWNDRGYAAIAMDTEGRMHGEVHEWGGPQRTGVYDDMDKDIGDHFMYHATADAILANSLLRSLPEVNAEQVGIIGVSWGGVITSTTIGIDGRFAFAIPTYGCGHMYDALNHWGDALEDNEMYLTVWDPVLRMENAAMPVLWYSWTDDYHFPMDCQAYCYHGAPGEHMVSLVPDMGHGHAAAWNRPESYDFADSIIASGTGWCVQQSISRTGSEVQAVFAADRPLTGAVLTYTTETGKTGDLTWTDTNVVSMVENPAGIWTITAELPDSTTGWFINTTADAGQAGPGGSATLYAGSDYQEIISVTLSDELVLSHPLTETVSALPVGIEVEMPTNVEFAELAATNETHPGSLSYTGAYPVVLYDDGSVDLQFDNGTAGLADGETASGTLQLVWENLDGSTDQVSVPYTVTARAAQTVVYEVSADWSSQEVYEIDDVIIRSNAVVTLDQDDAAAALSVESGTLLAEAGTLTLNGSGFAADGSVVIDGGAVDVETLEMTGAGTVQLKSGSLTFGSGSRMDLSLLEISGGSADFGIDHVRVGMGGTAELRVVGRGASVQMTVLNLQPWTADDPTLRFVLDEAGVSPINVSSFMNLPQAKIIADGTDYSGGATNMVLIDSTNLATLGDTNNYSVVGFEEKGLAASIVEDQDAGKDWVELVITETAYGSWIREYELEGSELDKAANPDGDAYTNEEEYIAGLNPSAADGFEVGSFSGDTLVWDAVSGRVYSVYFASNLVDGFMLIESNAVDGVFTDSDAGDGPQGFYRVSVGLEP